MSEENKALIRHYMEENYNRKNREAADALFASDFVNHAVMARVTLSATHSGVFMSIAPTGKRVVWTGIDIFRIADGKIAERWVAVDRLGLLLQLGAEVK